MRKYITSGEFERVLAAASDHPRDALLVLLSFRHGLRVSEALGLRWRDLDLEDRSIFIQRLKGGVSGTHPLAPDECSRIQTWRHSQDSWSWNGFVFVSSTNRPITRQHVHRLLKRYGQLANLSFPLHPHCLRHGTGFFLANEGHDTRLIQSYLGHRSIASTTIYTETNRNRFVELWASTSGSAIYKHEMDVAQTANQRCRQ